ncbi:stress responsive A/B barrel domain protein [Rhexocercosporidium sp. MPI-PUGE-AT-0058]|nr:stress responsive A/B barrel domain protein [Rhexocercosporidium sp. MPI-PUGE-AT-0058]
MTVIHIVLFKFKPAATAIQREAFIKAAKSLKSLTSVKDGRLIFGGPSLTDPISKSKGFQCALVSYHNDLKAVEEYHASEEHERLKSTYVLPLTEDLVRFDFEVDREDEDLVGVLPMVAKQGVGSI